MGGEYDVIMVVYADVNEIGMASRNKRWKYLMACYLKYLCHYHTLGTTGNFTPDVDPHKILARRIIHIKSKTQSTSKMETERSSLRVQCLFMGVHLPSEQIPISTNSLQTPNKHQSQAQTSPTPLPTTTSTIKDSHPSSLLTDLPLQNSYSPPPLSPSIMHENGLPPLLPILSS